MAKRDLSETGDQPSAAMETGGTPQSWRGRLNGLLGMSPGGTKNAKARAGVLQAEGVEEIVKEAAKELGPLNMAKLLAGVHVEGVGGDGGSPSTASAATVPSTPGQKKKGKNKGGKEEEEDSS